MDMGRIPREQVEGLVISALRRPGSTVGAIEACSGRGYSGDGSQAAHRDMAVWHRKGDVDAHVANELRLHPDAWGPKRTSNEFNEIMARVVLKLKKKGIIADLGGSGGHSVLRLAADPGGYVGMSTTEVAPGGDSQGDLKGKFLAILSKGRKDNTYKFALARAILDHCAESRGGAPVLEIPYEYLADKFLSYYWYQECKFRIKQDFHPDRDPMVLHIIRDVFGGGAPGDFKPLDEENKIKARGQILKKVFGEERKKTSHVVPKFQKIPVGRTSRNFPVFYAHSDREQRITLRPEAYEFLVNNHAILSRVVLAEWAKFLERANKTLPMLVSKIEHVDSRRGSLAAFLREYRDHFDSCFYCGNTLESGYTDVDHFIPWSYIFSDDAWNMVLACRKCNCNKSDSLAQEEFLDDLIRRNKGYSGSIRALYSSLDQIDTKRGWDREIRGQYENCKDYGFGMWPGPRAV